MGVQGLLKKGGYILCGGDSEYAMPTKRDSLGETSRQKVGGIGMVSI